MTIIRAFIREWQALFPFGAGAYSIIQVTRGHGIGDWLFSICAIASTPLGVLTPERLQTLHPVVEKSCVHAKPMKHQSCVLFSTCIYFPVFSSRPYDTFPCSNTEPSLNTRLKVCLYRSFSTRPAEILARKPVMEICICRSVIMIQMNASPRHGLEKEAWYIAIAMLAK